MHRNDPCQQQYNQLTATWKELWELKIILFSVWMRPQCTVAVYLWRHPSYVTHHKQLSTEQVWRSSTNRFWFCQRVAASSLRHMLKKESVTIWLSSHHTSRVLFHYLWSCGLELSTSSHSRLIGIIIWFLQPSKTKLFSRVYADNSSQHAHYSFAVRMGKHKLSYLQYLLTYSYLFT